jgi:hypothetical protein
MYISVRWGMAGLLQLTGINVGQNCRLTTDRLREARRRTSTCCCWVCLLSPALYICPVVVLYIFQCHSHFYVESTEICMPLLQLRAPHWLSPFGDQSKV